MRGGGGGVVVQGRGVRGGGCCQGRAHLTALLTHRQTHSGRPLVVCCGHVTR